MDLKLTSSTQSGDNASSRAASKDAYLTTDVRTAYGSLSTIEVPTAQFRDAQTRQSLKHFSIGQFLMPREIVNAYAIPSARRRSPETSVAGSTTELCKHVAACEGDPDD
jgi:hypothetical protein